jgi:hypothetical protein
VIRGQRKIVLSVRKNKELEVDMRRDPGWLHARQFPELVLTTKKSILIVGHRREIVCKNQVIAMGYGLVCASRWG